MLLISMWRVEASLPRSANASNGKPRVSTTSAKNIRDGACVVCTGRTPKVDQMTDVLACSTPQTCADSRGGRSTSAPRRPEDFAAMSFRSVACLNL